uniref:Uncharacterized protein n=1 Tax=Anguilla anguilla TaxID=7936 RepID=A0A0E9WME5_ANGAN
MCEELERPASVLAVSIRSCKSSTLTPVNHICVLSVWMNCQLASSRTKC